MNRPTEAIRSLLGDKQRCVRCHWPLHERPMDGCTAESCALRPMPAVDQDQVHRNEILAWIEEIESHSVLLNNERAELDKASAPEGGPFDPRRSR